MSASNHVQLRAAFVAGYLSANDARIAKQAQALRDNGWSVDLMSWQSANGPYPSLPEAYLLDWVTPAKRLGFDHLPVVAQNLIRARSQRRVLETALIAGQYHVVISSDPETLRPSATAKQKGGYGLVYDAHEYFPDEVPDDPARGEWVAKVHKQAGSKVDAFITVNEAIADLYQQTSPELGHAEVVKNASPSRAFIKDDGRLRALAKVTKDHKIILFQGGLARDRGLIALVDAMKTAPNDWVLVLMGSGPFEQILRERAGENVRFVAPQNWRDLHLFTAGADLGAVLYEGTCANQRLCSPNKLWEYPAAGLPILASNLPYLDNVIGKTGIGFVVDEPLGAHAISLAIASLTPTALAQAREAAATFTATNTWESQAVIFVQSVKRAASIGRRGRQALELP